MQNMKVEGKVVPGKDSWVSKRVSNLTAYTKWRVGGYAIVSGGRVRLKSEVCCSPAKSLI